MGHVSENAVQEAIDGIIVNREKRREIQRMTAREMTEYLVRLYRHGFEDGADAIQHYLEETRSQAEAEAMPFEEVTLEWDDVLAVIAKVRGIGAKTIAKIDQKLREVY